MLAFSEVVYNNDKSSCEYIDLLVYYMCYYVYSQDLMEMYPRNNNAYNYYNQVKTYCELTHFILNKNIILHLISKNFEKINLSDKLERYGTKSIFNSFYLNYENKSVSANMGFEFEFFCNKISNGYYSGDTSSEDDLFEQQKDKRYIFALINRYNPSIETILYIYQHIWQNTTLNSVQENYIFDLIVKENSILNTSFKSKTQCKRRLKPENPYCVTFCRIIYKLYFDGEYEKIANLLKSKNVQSFLQYPVTFALFTHDKVTTKQFVLLKPLLFISILDNNTVFTKIIMKYIPQFCTSNHFEALLSNVLHLESEYEGMLQSIYQFEYDYECANKFFNIENINQEVIDFFKSIYNSNNYSAKNNIKMLFLILCTKYTEKVLAELDKK